MDEVLANTRCWRLFLLALSFALPLYPVFARQDGDGVRTITSVAQVTGTVSPSLANEIRMAKARGIDWLLSQQREDGSWSNRRNPAITALAADVLMRSGQPSSTAALERALAFIVSCVQDDGGIYYMTAEITGGLKGFNTAVCMSTLYATGDERYRDVISGARAYIAGSQHLGADEYKGGFGYMAGETDPYTGILTTFYAARAMHMTRALTENADTYSRRDIDWTATVAFLQRLQYPPASAAGVAGGFGYLPVQPANARPATLRAYGGFTYAGLLSFIYANVSREDIRVQSAFDWASRHWDLEENPGMGRQGLYFFYAVLAKALHVTGVDLVQRVDGTFVNWRHDLGQKLVALQRIDPRNGHGYWENADRRFWEDDRVLVSVYALSALQRILPGETIVSD